MIFVDTGAWFAVIVPTDPDHAAANAWFAENREPLITSDYVVDETLTLLRARGERRRASEMGLRFFQGRIAHIHFLNEADIRAAWRVFVRFADKDWSFTDCTSMVLCERLAITSAFAFDTHFRQFGSLSVWP